MEKADKTAAAELEKEGALRARVVFWLIKAAAALGLLVWVLDPPQGGGNPQVPVLFSFVLVLPPTWQARGCFFLWLIILFLTFQAGKLLMLEGIGSMLFLLIPILYMFFFLKKPCSPPSSQTLPKDN